jgi:hypothetical protein
LQDNYCSKYDRHHEYFCKDKNVVADADAQNRANKFCASYDAVCGPDYKEKLKQYCSKYVQHYQTYCKNPFEHGAAAVRFCPLYAQECSGDFSVPLLEGLTTPNPLLQTPAPTQGPRQFVTYFPPDSQTLKPVSSNFFASNGVGNVQQQRQPQAVGQPQPQAAVQTQATGPDPSQTVDQSQSTDPTGKTPEQIKMECDRNRARATAYCFGPIGQSSLYKRKCDLFKQYCLNN